MSGLEEVITDFKPCGCKLFEFWNGYKTGRPIERDSIIVFLNPNKYLDILMHPKVFFNESAIVYFRLNSRSKEYVLNQVNTFACNSCGRPANFMEQETLMKQAHLFIDVVGAYAF